MATFKLTAADVRSKNNYALQHVCEGGHLDVLQWLTVKFGLKGDLVGDAARYLASANGHPDVARWLAGVFGWVIDD